jgi:hypothetical protein
MYWPTGQFEGAQVLLVVSEYPVTQDTHTVEDVQVLKYKKKLINKLILNVI